MGRRCTQVTGSPGVTMSRYTRVRVFPTQMYALKASLVCFLTLLPPKLPGEGPDGQFPWNPDRLEPVSARNRGVIYFYFLLA